MNPRRPWQPHMTEDRILNPFAPATDASQPIENIEVDEEDAGEGEAAPEAAATPKAEKTPPAAD